MYQYSILSIGFCLAAKSQYIFVFEYDNASNSTLLMTLIYSPFCCHRQSYRHIDGQFPFSYIHEMVPLKSRHTHTYAQHAPMAEKLNCKPCNECRQSPAAIYMLQSKRHSHSTKRHFPLASGPTSHSIDILVSAERFFWHFAVVIVRPLCMRQRISRIKSAFQIVWPVKQQKNMTEKKHNETRSLSTWLE